MAPLSECKQGDKFNTQEFEGFIELEPDSVVFILRLEPDCDNKGDLKRAES